MWIKIRRPEYFIPQFIVCWLTGAILAMILFCPKEYFDDLMTYTNHSWIETEAQYVSSSERYFHVLGEMAITVDDDFPMQTHCNWLYRYEIDGREYTFNSTLHEESQPDSKQLVKKILVAKDDFETLLFYSRAEVILNVALRILGAALTIIVSVRINKYILKKEKAAEEGNSDTQEPYEFGRDVPFPHGWDK